MSHNGVASVKLFNLLIMSNILCEMWGTKFDKCVIKLGSSIGLCVHKNRCFVCFYVILKITHTHTHTQITPPTLTHKPALNKV